MVGAGGDVHPHPPGEEVGGPEPNESILREFDLSAIGQYFPEYEREIRHRLHG